MQNRSHQVLARSLSHIADTAWYSEIGSLRSLDRMHLSCMHSVTSENQFHCTKAVFHYSIMHLFTYSRLIQTSHSHLMLESLERVSVSVVSLVQSLLDGALDGVRDKGGWMVESTDAAMVVSEDGPRGHALVGSSLAPSYVLVVGSSLAPSYVLVDVFALEQWDEEPALALQEDFCFQQDVGHAEGHL